MKVLKQIIFIDSKDLKITEKKINTAINEKNMKLIYEKIS